MLFVGSVFSHGMLSVPPSRSSAWRFGYDTPVNNDDWTLNCGGFQVRRRHFVVSIRWSTHIFSINGIWVANVVSAVIRLMECARTKHPMESILPVLPHIPTKRDPWLMFMWTYWPIIWDGSGSRSVQWPITPSKSLNNVWIGILWRSLQHRRNQLVCMNGSSLALPREQWIRNGTFPSIVLSWDCPKNWLANDVSYNGIGKMPIDGTTIQSTMVSARASKKRSAAALMFESSHSLIEILLSLLVLNISDWINRQKRFLVWRNQFIMAKFYSDHVETRLFSWKIGMHRLDLDESISDNWSLTVMPISTFSDSWHACSWEYIVHTVGGISQKHAGNLDTPHQ